MIFIKSFKKYFFIVRGDNDYLFRDPGEDGDRYFFSDVFGGERKEGAAVFLKDEAKRVLKYLKDSGIKDVRLRRQQGLLVKDGKAFEDHNKGESNYNEKGEYKHKKKDTP